MKNYKSFWFYILSLFTLSACLKKDIELEKCGTETYLHTAPVSAVGAGAIAWMNVTGFNGYQSLVEFDSTKTVFPEIPSNISNNFNVSSAFVNGRKVVTITPKTGASGKYVIYIHGGGYVANALQAHFDIIENLINRTGATFILPDYGLAPYHTYPEAYSLIQNIYDSLVAAVGNSNVIIMGDSAGGGLSLGFTQKLKLEGKQLPNQVILFSPWLDITLSNPDIENIQDPMLNAYGLRQAGLLWAGNTNPSFYQLSPINGPLEGLPHLSIFQGGRDMFMADVAKLRKMMADKCLQLKVYEYPQMLHVWVGGQILPEAKHAYGQIAELINN